MFIIVLLDLDEMFTAQLNGLQLYEWPAGVYNYRCMNCTVRGVDQPLKKLL